MEDHSGGSKKVKSCDQEEPKDSHLLFDRVGKSLPIYLGVSLLLLARLFSPTVMFLLPRCLKFSSHRPQPRPDPCRNKYFSARRSLGALFKIIGEAEHPWRQELRRRWAPGVSPPTLSIATAVLSIVSAPAYGQAMCVSREQERPIRRLLHRRSRGPGIGCG